MVFGLQSSRIFQFAELGVLISYSRQLKIYLIVKGGGDYATTDLIGPVGSGGLPIMHCTPLSSYVLPLGLRPLQGKPINPSFSLFCKHPSEHVHDLFVLLLSKTKKECRLLTMPFRRMTYFTVHMPCGNNGGFIFRNQCYGLVCM